MIDSKKNINVCGKLILDVYLGIVFKEAIKIGLTPMLSSLSILSVADVNSEQEMLGYGIAIIMANIGMYFVAPVMVVYGIKKTKLVRF